MKKQRDLAHAIIKELGTRDVKHKVQKFNATGWADKVEIDVNGTEVTVVINPVRSGGIWHSFFSGKVRIAVQDGGYDTNAKRFHEKKVGFDFAAIVDYIIVKAEQIKVKNAAFRTDTDLQETVRVQAESINAALGLIPYRGDVWVVEKKRKLHVEVPGFQSTEHARAVAKFVRDLLAKKPERCGVCAAEMPEGANWRHEAVGTGLPDERCCPECEAASKQSA